MPLAGWQQERDSEARKLQFKAQTGTLINKTTPNKREQGPKHVQTKHGS